MTGLKQRVVSGLRWQVAAKVGSQVISWGVTIAVMRMLAPADYGLMSMVMVIVGLTALVGELGLGVALIRAPEATESLQRHVSGIALLASGGLYALLLALAPLSAWAFDEPRLWLLTLVAGLQLPLAALGVVPESMARRGMVFKPLSIIELCTQVGGALVTLAMAWSGLGVWALVGGHLAAGSIKSLSLVARFGTVAPSFQLRGQRQLLGFGGSLTVNRVLWYFTTQADVFIAGRLLGAQLLGFYAVAVNLASLPMQKLMAVSNQVTFSAFAKLQGNRPALLDALQSSMGVLLALSTGILWAMAGVAGDLIPWLLGPKWTDAVPLLQLVAMVVPLRIASSTTSTAIIATGMVGTDLRNTLVSAAIMVPSFALGAHHGGVLGLALAWALGYPIVALILFYRARRVLGFGFRRLLRAFSAPVLAGAAMLAAMFAVSGLATGASAPVRLLAQCAAGAAVYLLVLLLADRSLIAHGRSLLGLDRPAP